MSSVGWSEHIYYLALWKDHLQGERRVPSTHMGHTDTRYTLAEMKTTTQLSENALDGINHRIKTVE